MSDNVNHPAHYVKEGRKECIDEMLEKFGGIAVYWFSKLNAFKYRYRAGDKDGNSEDQDIAKAEWYERKAAEMLAYVDPNVWTNCKYAMPNDGRRVMILTRARKMFVAEYDSRWNIFSQRIHGTVHTWYREEITHWKPLPNLPEDENNGKSS